MRRAEAAEHNEQSVLEQWAAAVKNATSAVTGRAVRILHGRGKVAGAVVGDIKKRINVRKKRECGELTRDIPICRKHYKWLAALDRAMKETREVPWWLRENEPA